jgi:C1A family cysteine protease
MSEVKRIYNLKPDKRDHRDLLCAVAPSFNLAPVVDLRPLAPPIENQGDLGSCTAFAGVGGAFDFLELKELRDKAPLTAAPEEFGATFQPGSHLFAYYNERSLEGSVSEDSGGQLRDMVKCLAQWGVCPEPMWPYNIAQFAVKPPDACYHEALKHKISQYARLTSLQQMKTVLASGFPFVFGIYVYESFESQAVAATGKVPMPGAYEQCLGGHAVCAVGYNDHEQCLIVRNSWGVDWGDKGYFHLPYHYIQNPNLAMDFWVIRK